MAAALVLTGLTSLAGAEEGNVSDGQVITVDGIIRTVVEENYSRDEVRILVADVDGVLLNVPEADVDELADRQPVAVTIAVPDGMTTPDALASAGGAVPGDEARVLTVVPTGDAPVRTGLDDPDGVHTVTVLPVSWEESQEWDPHRPADDLENFDLSISPVIRAADGRLVVETTMREPVVLPGPQDCDQVRLYNAAMRAHGERAPGSAREHIMVLTRGCSPVSSVLGGSQMWLPRSDLHWHGGHALGHNLGLGHSARVWHCPAVVGALPAVEDCLSDWPIGDGMSVMGFPGGSSLPAPFVEVLGWSRAITPTPDTVVAVPVSRESPLQGSGAVRIPMRDGGFLYPGYLRGLETEVELRRLVWIDGTPTTVAMEPIRRGAVRTIDGSDYVVSLDGSPTAVLRVVHRSLDTTPPTTPVITEPAHGSWVSDRHVWLSWQPATDTGLGVIGYAITIDGQWVGDVTETERVGVSVDPAPHGFEGDPLRASIVVTAIDAAGNMTASEPLVLRRPGPSAPPSSVVLETGYTSVTAAWEDAESSPMSTSFDLQLDRDEVRVRTVRWQSYMGEKRVRFDSLTPGSDYILTIRGDNAYGVGAAARVPFVIDPPTIAVETVPATWRQRVDVSWTLGETSAVPPSSMRVAVNGAAAVTTSGSASSTRLPQLPPGTHDVVVHAVDPWGDEVASEPVPVTVEGVHAAAFVDPTGTPVISWQLHPSLSSQVERFVIGVDGVPTRRVGPRTAATELPLPPGTSQVGVTALAVDGTTLAVDSVEVVVGPATHLFTDVPFTHTFADDILWLAQTGVTTGYSDGSFQPTRAVTRGQMAAFLYRYASADLTGHTPPTRVRFADVPASHSFHTEISWLAESGVTSGYADGSFRPNRTITRAEMAAFLYRFREAHREPPSRAPFPDVPASHTFATEIAWLSQTGITTGYTDGTFRPRVSVTRAAMAAYLHRMQG